LTGDNLTPENSFVSGWEPLFWSLF